MMFFARHPKIEPSVIILEDEIDASQKQESQKQPQKKDSVSHLDPYTKSPRVR